MLVTEGTLGKQLLLWDLAGFLFTVAAGTLLHFAFAWSGGNPAVAAFSAVNESTWEHMKLLFFPLFLVSVVEFCVPGGNTPNFPAVRAISAALGTALIPVLFYTYTGIFGRHWLAADIAVFVLAALAAGCLDFMLRRRGAFSKGWMQVLGLLTLWGMAFSFVYFTFHPPLLPLWQDPVTLQYAIP